MRRRPLFLTVAVCTGFLALLAYLWATTKQEAPTADGRQVHQIDAARAPPPGRVASTPEKSALSNSHPANDNNNLQSLSEKVAKLSSSGKAADSFAAYQILANCNAARESAKKFQLSRASELTAVDKARLESGELQRYWSTACGDLGPSSTAQRLRLAEFAAEHGVHMAAVMFLSEGPFGDHTAESFRETDPLVVEWRRRGVMLLKLAAEKADVAAMTSLVEQYETGSGVATAIDSKQAYFYSVALSRVYELQGKKPPFGLPERVNSLQKRVTQEDAGLIRTSALQMAQQALTQGRNP